MDRIAEIKRCLLVADGDEKIVSKHRWKAAKLIWEEVKDGKSRRELGEEIGKSHTHVRFMYNCWDMVGRKLLVSAGLDSLPNFQAIYTSDEVRGTSDSDEHKEGSGSRKREPGKDPRSEYTAHGLVVQADNAIDALLRSPAYHQLISDEDIVILRKLPAEIRSLIRKCGR
jgi:hypothetical protein